MGFVSSDRLESILPEAIEVRAVRQLLVVQEFRVDAHSQDFFVVTTIEDPEAAALGKPLGGAPEKVVVQLLGRRLLEREHLAAGRIHPGHYGPDGAVLPGRVHGLEDQQHGVAVVGVQNALRLVELLGQAVEAVAARLLGGRVTWGLSGCGPDREVTVERDQVGAFDGIDYGAQRRPPRGAARPPPPRMAPPRNPPPPPLRITPPRDPPLGIRPMLGMLRPPEPDRPMDGIDRGAPDRPTDGTDRAPERGGLNERPPEGREMIPR